MTNLILIQENDGLQRTLKPDKEYLVGNSSECLIVINSHYLASKHLKFYFNHHSGCWMVQDTSNGIGGTFINNQSITEFPITQQTRISLANQVFLQVIPNNISIPPPPKNTSSSSAYSYSHPPSPSNASYDNNQPQSSSYGQNSQVTSSAQSSGLRLLTWKQYVDEQVNLYSDKPFIRFCGRFFLFTGFRNTPWVRKFSGYTMQGGNSLDAFEGYVIPDFSESQEKVMIEVEKQIAQVRRYENTDCFNVRLTDAHVADSATQSFLGVELFPIVRGGKPDYRRFTVISYHRVRTYLLVENYGTDLFVSWITRFEPQPSAALPLLWLIMAIILSIFLGGNMNSFIAFILPIGLWGIYYYATPFNMEKLNILPKPANARLVIFLLMVLYFIIMIPLGIASLASMLGV